MNLHTDPAKPGTDIAIVLPEGRAIAALFEKPRELDAVLKNIAAAARAHVPDLTTDAGRKAVASVAYKVASSKSALDKAGLKLTETMREAISGVNAERKRAEVFLDSLKAEVRKPLTDWEKAEERRKADLQDRLGAFVIVTGNLSATEIADQIERIGAVQVGDDWQEFRVTAVEAQRSALERLNVMHEAAAAREAQERELAELRAEKARRAAEDAERAAREARERAARQAEEARQREAAEAKERAERAAAEEQERREGEARERQEAAGRAAEAARLQAEREAAAAIDAANERARQAEAAAARAAQEERDRIEADRKAEADRAAEAQRRAHEADAERAADETHRERIRSQIEAAVKGILAEKGKGKLPPAVLADALIAGRIPHCEVRL